MEFIKKGKAMFEAAPEGAMRAPLRIYASDAIFEKMKSDRTLLQAANVATLPGILGSMMVMPDGHEGYGFPIGGVAGFDAEEGVVSPGGVGYDINCLCKGAKIIDFEGNELQIESVEKRFNPLWQCGQFEMSLTSNDPLIVRSYDATGKPRQQIITAFMKKMAKEDCIRLETKEGKQIETTGEHPILTQRGMVKARELNEKDTIAIQSKHEHNFFEAIENISKHKYAGWVYDVTVSNTHNFIANGIIVSNCGVRLLRTNLTEKDIKPKMKQLTKALFDNIPSGVGSKSKIRPNPQQMEEAVTTGMKWALEQGYAVEADLEHCEENGHFDGADFSKVSAMAKKRGTPQFGTLGSGNHFLEVQKVEKIFDPVKAKAFGITGEGQVTVMIHSGSRGLGHQVCDDYLRTMLPKAKDYGLELADRELCCAPISSSDAQDYLGAMRCAINFAFNNRQVMTSFARNTFQQVLGGKWEDYDMSLVYDVCHNIAKFEEHDVDGKRTKVCVHRKGATRALWPGNELIPKAYRSVGQPVIIPGSMNTASYLLCGGEGSRLTFGSSCHGAGRVMSRSQAKRDFNSTDIIEQMQRDGVDIQVAERNLLAEEYGKAYKDVNAVVQAVEDAGISTIVAKLVPMGVIKG